MLVAHSKSARVASPASAVWQLVGDPTAWERWAGGIDGVSVRDGLAVGRTITYRHRGRPVDVVISAYEPQRRLAITRIEPSYEMRESIELEGDEEETTVSIAMAFEPLALWARVAAPLVSPFRRILLGRPLMRSLRALRDAAEETGGRGAPAQ